jgi:secreted trypsin-like serine protease
MAGCAARNKYGVYGRVSHVHGWIESYIRNVRNSTVAEL